MPIGKHGFQKGHKLNVGEKSKDWKGENASYVAIHQWVRRWKKKTQCSVCGEKDKRLEWANIDHQYRRNLDDYICLCVRCHKIYDIKTGLVNIDKFKHSKKNATNKQV